MNVLKNLCSKILGFPRETLVCIDEKIGIEIFKLGMVFSTVYFVQGMGGLSNIPLLFYFKDILRFDEAQMQYFSAITGIAWLIKPLFGYISDRFPIFGYRRKSYMILMASVAAFSWWLLAFMVYHNYSRYVGLVLVFNFSSLGYAFVDVVCDALMVERGQALNKEDVFVNLQWFALGIAGFIASFFSGELQYAVKSGIIPLYQVFIPVGMIPLLTSAIGWFFVNEEKIGKSGGENPAEEKQRVDLGIIKEVVSSRIFWILTAFIFFWKFSPSFGAVFQYYSIDLLDFDERFLGKINAIGNAIFPLSVVFYAALLKWLPRIKTKHYLYASIVVGFVYYLMTWLFTLHEGELHRVGFRLPHGEKMIECWIAPMIIFLVIFSLGIYFITVSKKRFIEKKSAEYGARIDAAGDCEQSEWSDFSFSHYMKQSYWERLVTSWQRLRFFVSWPVILVLSLVASLWFGGFDFRPFALSYRSLRITESVIFGYASIASFLIPLALAAKLAPKKAEGMTYAYFMALSNVSAGFLPDITGAWMFKIIKKACFQPESLIKTIPLDTWLIIFEALILAVILVLVIRQKKIWSIVLASVSLALGCYLLGPVLIAHLKSVAIYFVQQSFVTLKPFIGDADFWGREAYRALIIRYFLIISCFFMLTAIPFVYLLSRIKDKKGTAEE